MNKKKIKNQTIYIKKKKISNAFVGIETSTHGFQIQWSTNWNSQADWVYGSKLPNKNITW